MAERTISAGIKPKPTGRALHRIAILTFDGVVFGDLAVPLEIFGRVRGASGQACYDLRVCSAYPEVTSRYVRLHVPWRFSSALRADTLIVPGIEEIESPISPAVLRVIIGSFKRGARIASICTGAFILARAGLLNGLCATTHWAAAAELARRYPQVAVNADVLYIDNGQVLTSAGAAAGMDLCLHIVRRDCGASVAASAARAAVMPLERSGGQAQFIVHQPPEVPESMEPVLQWMERNLRQKLSLSAVARHARMSSRTLSRRFRDQVGTTPAQWIAKARVRRAQHLLETTPLPIDSVATEAGFRSAAVLREHFGAAVGTSPSAYRRSFVSPDDR